MKRFVLAAALALLSWPVAAQTPPNPPPTSYQPPVSTPPVSLSVTSVSARVAMTAAPSAYPVFTVVNLGSAEIFCRGGDGTAAATTSAYTFSVPANGYRSTWDRTSTYVACITASGTATARITQSNGAPQLGYTGLPSGLPPTGAAGGDLAGNYPAPTVVNLSHVTNASLLNSGLANSSLTVNGTSIALGASGTVTAAAGTLTGTTLASNVTASSLLSAAGGAFGSGAFSSAYSLPVAQAATIGGVFSKAAVSHNFLTSISSANGAIGQAQPACADLSDAGSGCSGAASAVGANPSQAITGAAHNGSAATFMRSDASPALGTLTQQTVVNLNAASAPAPITGAVLQVIGADSANGFIENDTFGASPIFTGRRADGTGASPTAVQSAETLAGFSARPYDGSAYASASTGNVQAVASENFSATNHGTDIIASCTAITTTTTAECGRFKSSGFTIPTGGTYQINNTQISASNLSNGVSGTGAVVLATNAALITPNLGTPSALVLTNASGTCTGCSIAAGSSNTGAFAGNISTTVNGAASSAPLSLTGSIFGGTGTTTFGVVKIEPAGTTAATSWNTGGEVFEINTPTGYGGNIINYKHNGGSGSTFKVDSNGNVFTSTGFPQWSQSNGTYTDVFTATANHVWTIGGYAAASPVSYTLQVGEDGSGTNIVGGSSTLRAGLSTGSANSPDFIFQTGGAVGGSGTTAATATEVLRLTGVTNLVKLGAPSTIANGTATVTNTSLGPTGTACVIGDWFKMLDSAGNTRYAPLYNCT